MYAVGAVLIAAALLPVLLGLGVMLRSAWLRPWEKACLLMGAMALLFLIMNRTI